MPSTMRKPSTLMTIALTLAGVAVGGALVAAAVVYGGLYNVASTTQHLQPTFTLMETAMRQSVRLRAREVEVPPLADESLVLKGAGCFRDKCVQCHGAPGVAQGDIGKSLQPVPGPLVDARRHWQARELYWVTRHGIKMSGMPAWDYRLSEAELWAVVAFMQRLPDLDAQQYALMAQRAPQACGRERGMQAASRPGDVERGKQALFQYACNACHTIPGVTSSSPQVGPPLAGMAGRTLIGGVLANSPENMVRWLRETQQVKPMTAMPQLDVAEQDARDIAAYLGTLH
ncbi:MAG: c-type cytochrome [Comamonadaceae bacterium]|nr:MAG: c-type cytochrome [Comamonadaceae bacterium]